MLVLIGLTDYNEAEYMKNIIMRRGCSVHIARDVKSMLKRTVESPYEYIFFDAEWIENGCPSLEERIVEVSRQTRVVVLAGNEKYTMKAFQLHVSGYIVRPVTEEKINWEFHWNQEYGVEQRSKEKPDFYIRTFGTFECFVEGRPVAFRYQKTKELLAYLIDRRGAMCTNQELVSVLWGDQDLRKKASYLKNLKTDLAQVFSRVDRSEALIRQRGMIGVVPDKIPCDYFELEKNGGSFFDVYRGEYMSLLQSLLRKLR